MKKIIKVFTLFMLILVTGGCCFSAGSIVIGKDCNKKMYCNAGALDVDYTFNLPTSLSESYNKSVKSVVTILAQSNSIHSSSSSSGSGIAIKEDENFLYIVTNRHVLASKTSNYTLFYNKIEVVFSDYKRVEAVLVDAADDIDVAVVKVAKSSVAESYTLPVVKDSFKDIAIGDSIFALGSPLGLDHAFSATFGSISNLYNTKVDFSSANLGTYYPIQIDAAVNPGNSGGGLFNSNGELVGMIQGGRTTSTEDNTTIVTTGINYALPITTVINVMNNLISNGDYEKPNFGVNDDYLVDLQNMSDGDRQSLNVPDSDRKGIFIRHVNINQPAAKAGMSKFFVINSIDGVVIDSKGEWEMYLASKNAGDVVSVKGHYISDTNSEITYQVTLD